MENKLKSEKDASVLGLFAAYFWTVSVSLTNVVLILPQMFF